MPKTCMHGQRRLYKTCSSIGGTHSAPFLPDVWAVMQLIFDIRNLVVDLAQPLFLDLTTSIAGENSCDYSAGNVVCDLRFISTAIGESGRTHSEAVCKFVAWHHNCGKDQRECEYEDGEENENGDQQIHWHARESVGHGVPTNES